MPPSSQNSFIPKAIYSIAWFLCFTIPIPFASARVGVLSTLLFIFWLFEGDYKRKFYCLKNIKLFNILGIFIAYTLLSLFWTKYTAVGIETLHPYKYFYLVLPVLITSIPQTKVPQLIQAFVYGMCVHVVIAVIYKYTPINLPYSGKIYTPYAVYAPFAAFCSLYFLNRALQSTYTGTLRAFYAFVFVLLSIFLFIEPGRSGQLAYIISISLLLFISHKKWSTSITSIFIIFAIFFFIAIDSPDTKQRYISGITEIQQVIQKQEYSGSWSARWGLLIANLEAAGKHPLFGAGIGDSRDELQRVIERGENQHFYTLSFWDGPHNQYITFLTKLGAIGLGLFIIYIMFFYKIRITDIEMKNLSVIFITMFAINCFADEILFMKPYNTYFIVFSALFMNLAREAESAQLRT